MTTSNQPTPETRDARPSHPDLQGLAESFEKFKRDVEALVDGRTPEQIAWKPGPDRWSIAQCLDHLDITAELYLPKLKKAIQEGRASGRGGAAPIRHGLFGGWFLKQVSPGASKPKGKGKGIKAPRMFDPSPEPSIADVLPQLIEKQDRFLARLAEADGLDLRKTKAASPVTGLLRFGIGTWFHVMARHQERHLAQARAVMEEPGFPS